MARERDRSAPRGDHHGRQRPVGRAARTAALGRTPHGRGSRPPHRARGHGARRPLPHHLQLLLGELGASGQRDRRPDGADAPLHPAGSGRAAPERRTHRRDRRARPRRPRAAGAHRRGGRAHLRQHRAQPADRLQLRIAGRDRQGCAAAGRAASWQATIKPQDITPEALSAALDTHGVPDPDLLIRTSGELRLSNFLLWQSAYTEFVFLDAFWPDFGRELLEQAIDEFRRRRPPVRRRGRPIDRLTRGS